MREINNFNNIKINLSLFLNYLITNSLTNLTIFIAKTPNICHPISLSKITKIEKDIIMRAW